MLGRRVPAAMTVGLRSWILSMAAGCWGLVLGDDFCAFEIEAEADFL
jgi:hypothetical protein